MVSIHKSGAGQNSSKGLFFWLNMAAFVSGALVCLTGLIVLIGWHTGSLALIRINHNLAGMVYNTALSFFFCGLSILFIIWRSCNISAICASIPLIVGSMTIAEYAFKTNLVIDKLFMQSQHLVGASSTGRMSPDTAACFVLAAASLMLCKKFNSWKVSLIAGILNCIILSSGAVVFLGYLIGLPTAYGWSYFTSMAVHTAFAFILVSAGLFCLIFAARAKKIFLEPVMPILCFFILMSLTSFLCQAMLSKENNTITHMIEENSIEIQHDLMRQINDIDLRRGAQESIDKSISAYVKRHYNIKIFNNAGTLYKNFQGAILHDSKFVAEKEIHIQGADFKIQISPSEELKAHITSLIDEMVLALGSLISFVLAWLIVLLQKLRKLNIQLGTASQAIFGQMKEGIVACEPDYRIININASAQNYLNIQNAIGRNFSDYIFDNFSISQRKDKIFETPYAHKSFDIIRPETDKFKALYLEINIDAMKNTEGEVSNIIAVIRDVTEARQEEVIKHNFLSMISHKLRTPLTIIHEGASILGEDATGALNQIQKDITEKILRKAEHLESLIQRLIKFAQISGAGIEQKIQVIDLCKHMRRYLESIASQDVGRPIDYDVLCPQKELIIDISTEALDLIMSNLIDNSIKFNDKPRIEIIIKMRRLASFAEISIADNGIGIAQEEAERIFQKFYQVEKNFTGEVEGEGLGLALIKKVLDDMGGSINFESKLGKGTTFTVSIPAPEVL